MADNQKSSNVLALGSETSDKAEVQAVVAQEAQTVDVSNEPVDGVAKVMVELDPDFENGVEKATVSVANYEDVVLAAGKPVEVTAAQAELMLSSPAVKVAE